MGPQPKRRLSQRQGKGQRVRDPSYISSDDPSITFAMSKHTKGGTRQHSKCNDSKEETSTLSHEVDSTSDESGDDGYGCSHTSDISADNEELATGNFIPILIIVKGNTGHRDEVLVMKTEELSEWLLPEGEVQNTEQSTRQHITMWVQQFFGITVSTKDWKYCVEDPALHHFKLVLTEKPQVAPNDTTTTDWLPISLDSWVSISREDHQKIIQPMCTREDNNTTSKRTRDDRRETDAPRLHEARSTPKTNRRLHNVHGHGPGSSSDPRPRSKAKNATTVASQP